jgi:predicted permease
MRFPWKRAESDLEREIAHHLHRLTVEYERQGYPYADAIRLAKREFGGREQTKERCRDESRWAWFNGLQQDIVFGLRMMRRAPVVTVAAVLSLALAIGSNTAILSLMNVVLWQDLPVPNPRQLTLVNWQGHGFPRDLANGGAGSMGPADDGWDVADFFSYPGSQIMRQSLSGKASLAAFTFADQVSVSFAGKPGVAQERGVSGNFLSTLQVAPHLGRLLSDNDDSNAAPPTVVLSHRFWVRELGSPPNVIGRALIVNNKPRVIVGVLNGSFYGLVPGDATEIYVPLHHGSVLQAHGGKQPLDDNRFWCISLIARRAPGVTESQLKPIFDTVFPATWSAQPKNPAKAPRIRLEAGSRGLGSLRREFRNPLLVLGALVCLLLLIACTNIANLLLARSAARQKEVATRISLGCSRTRLMRQFLTESALLAVGGGLLSIVVGYLTANLLGQFIAGRGGNTVPVAVSFDARIMAIAAITTAAALFLFGLFPAWRASRIPSAVWLKEGSGSVGFGPRNKWNAGRLLVLGQMAMSVVLVMSAVIFTRNLLAIESGDPGFDRRNLILFDIRPGTSGYDKSRLKDFYFNLERRLAATPGVATAGLASVRPMNIGGWWEGVQLVGQSATNDASINGVTPTYLSLFTPRLVAGRNIQWTDIATDAKVAVISEDLASKLGGASLLGRRLAFGDVPAGVKPEEFEIVGIAPVIAPTSMKQRPYAVWLPFGKESPGATVVLRTARPPQLVLPAVRQTMREIDANLPMVDVMTMEELISKGLQRERMFATLCNGFGILALVLSVVGLYGVVAYNTARRRGEIGLRLALGAVPAEVLSMVLREGMWLATLGLLMGLPIVWFGAKYLEKELFQMKPLESASILFALATLLACALVAVGIPALRASAIEPAETLRQE